jgi:serine/threonine protein kinase
VKLADFGLSKIIWDKDTLTPCGTVGYTAPEIVCDQKYSKGVDMWAVGCVLYTMLCGFPPFYDESISALTHKVARGQFSFLSPWWDPISDDAKNLIQGLLCVDPRKRYTVRQVLQHPWLTGKKPTLHSPARGPIDDTESIRIQAMRNAAVSSALKTSAVDVSPYPSMLSPILGNPGGMIDNDGNNDVHGKNNNERSIMNMVTDDSLSTLSDAESSRSSTRRKDVFSPGMATLKEIFDITAAVQRMAEEHTHHGDQAHNDDDDHRPDSINDRQDPLYTQEHRYQQHHHHHHQDSRPTSKRQYNAQAAAHHQQRLAKITGTTMTPAAMATGTHPSSAHGQRRHKPGFDLNMNNATLLKNRRMKHLVTPCQ